MGRAAGVLAQAGNTSAESLERRRHVNDGVASLMFPIAILRKCLPFGGGASIAGTAFWRRREPARLPCRLAGAGL